MPLGSTSAIHLKNAPLVAGSSASARPIQSVSIHPVALFAILDHFLRRKDDQERVIGTLLGVRSSSASASGTGETDVEVEVRNCFAVLHSETPEQVAVDMEYHRNMYELHQKVNPKEVIVGWYSTGSNWNTYSALIQNFYTHETAPHPSVHVVFNTGVEGESPGVKAYLSSPVGVNTKPENCVFIPIPCELRFGESERSGLDLLVSSLNQLSPSSSSSNPTSSNSSSSLPTTNLDVLDKSLRTVLDMLERVHTYVVAVLAGEREGDPKIGRYLLEALSMNTEGLEKPGFASCLQDTLMISYLANLVRAQAEVSARLQLVPSA